VESRTHRFPVTDTPPAVEVRNASGSVSVEGRDGVDEITVQITALDSPAEQLLDRVNLFFTHSRLQVEVPERRLHRTPGFAISVITPTGSAVRVAAASADTVLRGGLGDVVITTASGDVAVADCASLEVRTASGDARIGAVTGRTRHGSASGDLWIGSVGDGVTSRTASGDVSLDETSGDVSIGTASGDVTIGRAAEGSVQAKTMSGDVEVGVAPGLRVWLDLSSVSGRMNSQLPDDDGAAGEGPAQLSLTLRSVSGDLRIRRVTPAS
jgi:Putative adhesin